MTASDDDRPTVLFVDNFDSFTYNLVEYVSVHAATEVVRNTVSLGAVRAADPDAVVVSPGPGHPANERDVGVTLDVLREVSPEVPTLGVCLGLEAAVYAYGGDVGHAPEPVHGKGSPVRHDGRGVFEGLEQGFRGGRYHSLVATAVPDCFEVSATTVHRTRGTAGGTGDAAGGTGGAASRDSVEDVDGAGHVDDKDDADDGADGPEPDDGTGWDADDVDANPDGTELVMGVRHREHPISCVQFHPESVLTAVGHDVVGNFLSMVG